MMAWWGVSPHFPRVVVDEVIAVATSARGGGAGITEGAAASCHLRRAASRAVTDNRSLSVNIVVK